VLADRQRPEAPGDEPAVLLDRDRELVVGELRTVLLTVASVQISAAHSPSMTPTATRSNPTSDTTVTAAPATISPEPIFAARWTSGSIRHVALAAGRYGRW
jgi:hypothetical protein